MTKRRRQPQDPDWGVIRNAQGNIIHGRCREQWPGRLDCSDVESADSLRAKEELRQYLEQKERSNDPA